MKYVPFSWFNITLKRYIGRYGELMVIAIAVRLLLLIEPFVIQALIDRVLPFHRTATLDLIVALLIATTVFQIGLNVVSGILANLTANRVTNELGKRLYNHLLQLPLGFYHRWPVGEIMARIGEIDTIRSFIVGTTTGVTLDVIFAFIYVGALFSISSELTVIVLIALPIQALIYFGFGPFLRARLRQNFDANANYQANMVESFAGAVVVKSMAVENGIISKLLGSLDGVLHTNLRVQYIQIASGQLVTLVEKSLIIAIIYVGSGLVFAGQLTLGQLIAFHLLAKRVANPIASFSSLWESWQNIRISRQRLADILLETPEPIGTLPCLPRSRRTTVRMENVTFGYEPGHPIIRNLTMETVPGRPMVVVGPSGSGKSTLGKLFAGLVLPDHGRILVNGQDSRNFDPQSLRRTVAYIPQEPVLFSGSVRDNLVLGQANAGQAAIDRAVSMSASTGMIAQLSDGFDTDVGERGMNLSGGQRQRIAIARALLARPSVLVLDEPTSALDLASQRTLIQNMINLVPDVTLVFATHQPDLIPGPATIVDLGKLADRTASRAQANG